MHEPNVTECSKPDCICCQGYQAVKEYEQANGVNFETIEFNHEDLERLKGETGS